MTGSRQLLEEPLCFQGGRCPELQSILLTWEQACFQAPALLSHLGSE